MESISVFDIFKIGVGPSSSHTMGPWRAAQRFVEHCARSAGGLASVSAVTCDLFGSLAKTGRGHGTDVAVILGLSGHDPVTCDTSAIPAMVGRAETEKSIALGGTRTIRFDPRADIRFRMTRCLPFHANALTFNAVFADGSEARQTYYSVGGGFVVQEGAGPADHQTARLPFPIELAEELGSYCAREGATIPEIVRRNERTWRSDAEIDAGLLKIYGVMRDCIYRGCRTGGTLPGGLGVVRRAPEMNRRLLHGAEPDSLPDWLAAVRRHGREFDEILRWVSCFALAVNEENAAFGRVVTAPTNGAAGVIPAVMLYYELFAGPGAPVKPASAMGDAGGPDGIIEFMLVAGEIGSIFKKGATISAAMGGCQAEIGVSSAMAAAGLAHCLGADPARVLMAAEIAMEHHLGMTCDPIGGLVQIPCIERNTMGAMKAITAANIAMDSDPAHAKVSLDGVVRTMWETAKDMQSKYKETAEGGLAVNISVGISEC